MEGKSALDCRHLVEANTALATWFRRRQACQETTSNLATTPQLFQHSKTTLNVVRKSMGAQEFLRGKLNELVAIGIAENNDADNDSISTAEYFRVLATFHEALGDLSNALDCISKACAAFRNSSILVMKMLLRLSFRRYLQHCKYRPKTHWFHQETEESDVGKYIHKVASMDDFQKEMMWYKEKLSLAKKMKEAQTVSVLPQCSTFRVERVDGKLLTVEEFHKRYVGEGIPVIITGLENDIATEKFDLDLITRMAGIQNV